MNHNWLEYLGYYLDANPDPDLNDVFARFPELDDSEDKLGTAWAYILASRNDKVTKEWLKHKFPEFYPISIWEKFKRWTRRFYSKF